MFLFGVVIGAVGVIALIMYMNKDRLNASIETGGSL